MQLIRPVVNVIWSTPNPARVVALAAAQTMRRLPEASKILSDEQPDEGSIAELIEFLYRADHRSVFEHACMCVHLTGVSRAFMAQITRHRLASFTCSSQHYQDYSEYPLTEFAVIRTPDGFKVALDRSLDEYKKAIDSGVPKDIARMVLPEAMTVNMYMTANAREWAEILRQRLCRRNTQETWHIAWLLKEVLVPWFPELFLYVGPQCAEGQCKQGKLSCGLSAIKEKVRAEAIPN